MGRPKIDLDPYRGFILERYRAGTALDKILFQLFEEHGVKVGKTVLYERLRDWGEPVRQQRTRDSDALRQSLEDEFFATGMSDKELLEYLKSLGFQISHRGLVRLRKALGIRRRLDKFQLEERKEEVLKFLQTPSNSTILMPRLGRRSLWKHVQNVARINISEHQLFDIYSRVYPQEVASRLRALRAKRGGFTLPGPNYTWSVDGYCKLRDYGFDIYAGIDAYSRYIVWCFVGVSGLTERSVFAQYVRMVEAYEFMPMVIRSDHGSETGMLAAAHYWLSLGTTVERRLKPRRDRDGRVSWFMPAPYGGPDVEVDLDTMDPNAPLYGPERPFEFKDCYSYGKSTKNQRIESFWSQMCKGRSGFWRVSHSRSDSIACDRVVLTLLRTSSAGSVARTPGMIRASPIASHSSTFTCPVCDGRSPHS